MRKSNFHHRNRLIAAASRAVLIVEAREQSGTLITAARAAEIGRPLFVVPGHPGQVQFAGNLALLRDNASITRHFEDLMCYWKSESNPESLQGPPLGVDD
jgi:DNA processing protein